MPEYISYTRLIETIKLQHHFNTIQYNIQYSTKHNL